MFCLQNEILKEKFGWSDSDILVISRVSQQFFKNTAIFMNDQEQFVTKYNSEFPYTCSEAPWNEETETLSLKSLAESVNCTLNSDYYCASDENIQELIDIFEFPDPNYNVREWYQTTLVFLLTDRYLVAIFLFLLLAC